MRKMILKYVLFLSISIMIASCNDQVVFDESVGLIGFSTALVTMTEGQSASFDIYLHAPAGMEATDVTIAVSTTGLPVPAVEGTDYSLSAKTINLGVGEESVTVTSFDNDVYTGNKSFYITLASSSVNYPFAVPSTILVIIVDDEHPLTSWIGTYTVAASSYVGSEYDETWTVTTDVVPTDPFKLQIRGIAAEGSGPVVAVLDPVEMTIKIPSNQYLGVPYGPDFGSISIYYATDDIIAQAGLDVTAAMLTEAAADSISGTLNVNGNITIDRLAEIMDDYMFDYDVFNTTWTKQ